MKKGISKDDEDGASGTGNVEFEDIEEDEKQEENEAGSPPVEKAEEKEN